MIFHLSYWPWIFGAVAAFVVTLRYGYDGALGMGPLGFGVFCGAVTTCIAGLIEVAGSGLMAGEGISGFVNMFGDLGITSIPGSIGALLLATLLKYRPGKNKAPQ